MCNKDKDKYNHNLSRRDLLVEGAKCSAVIGAASLLGGHRLWAEPVKINENPRFFLHINIPSGLDASYFFDARPLSMTNANLQVNYRGTEPIPYVGKNGQSTLRTEQTEPLMKWADRFSVVNGVVMSPNLQGHDQLMNMLLTANPFGGDSFLPWANTTKAPMDYIQTDFVFAQFTNAGSSMILSAASCRDLNKRLGKLEGQQHILAATRANAERVGQGKSSLAASARRMAGAAVAVPDLSRRFSGLRLSEPANGNQNGLVGGAASNIEMIAEMMRAGIIQSAMLVLADNIDTHDVDSAKALPEKVAGIAKAIAGVFDYLDRTQSPSGRTMLDDTTILIGSEFSRTMRQENVAIDKTGTDHNPLTNTLIVAGAGIQGGLVIGKSDFNTPDEILSAAHLAYDAKRLSIMGLPFDHDSGRVIESVSSAAFDPANYLSPVNVVNTIQQVLGIPSERRFAIGRNLPVGKVIPGLIA